MSICPMVSISSSVSRFVGDSCSCWGVMNEKVLVSKGEGFSATVGLNETPCCIRKPENDDRAEVGLGLCTEKFEGCAQLSCAFFFCMRVGGVPKTAIGWTILLKKDASLESPPIFSLVICKDWSSVLLTVLLLPLFSSLSESESLQHKCSKLAMQLLSSSVSELPLSPSPW